jgi:hypothetical protein
MDVKQLVLLVLLSLRNLLVKQVSLEMFFVLVELQVLLIFQFKVAHQPIPFFGLMELLLKTFQG